ncbi:caprin-1-like [Tachypleus tridentatus]|uniref:caprin-1-like n=1 Tax=Tachypleus tridentatus TaxID=6853 RepID=UPI003FD069A4
MALSNASKHQKKVAKRERFEKQQEDIRVFKEVLLMQDVLKRMSTKDVQDQFVRGANKSLELSAKDLRNFDELFKLVSLERGMKEGDASFKEQLSMASEHLISLIEGKNKEVLGTTYKYMKELLLKINEFGCFDCLCEIQDREKYNFSDKFVTETNEETQLEIEVTTTENNQVSNNSCSHTIK